MCQKVIQCKFENEIDILLKGNRWFFLTKKLNKVVELSSEVNVTLEVYTKNSEPFQ